MLGGFQPAQRQRFRHVRAVGYGRSLYQRGGTIIGPLNRDPSRMSPWMTQRGGFPLWRMNLLRQRGGALYRRRPTLTDKIAEGVAMGLSGPSPSFLKLGAFLGKQAVKGIRVKGIRDNVRHARRV